MVGIFDRVHKKIDDTITVDTDKKIQFRDTGIYIQSSADGKLLISSDGSGADDITLTGNVTFSNDIAVTGDLTVSGDFTFGDASTDTLTVTGKLDANGDVDLGSGDDTVNIGSGSGDTLNLADDLTVATTKKVQFRDTGLYINSSADGQLDIVADTTVALSGAVTADSTLDITGNTTVGGTLDITGLTTATAGIEIAGADKSITFSGTNTGTVPALVLPDDTYIADADGSLGAAAGFIVVDIGGTNYKLQTYAMS